MLLRLALCFALGVAVADVFSWDATPLARVLLLGCTCTLACPRSFLRDLCVGLAGALSLASSLEAARGSEPPERAVVAEGRVEAVRSFGDRTTLRVCELALPDPIDRIPPTCVRVWAASASQVLPGDRIRFAAKFRRPAEARNPGEVDRRRALARRGVGWEGHLRYGSLIVRLEPADRFRALHAFRRRIATELGQQGPGGALLAGLALGHREHLPPTLHGSFAALGLAHLLAVSGLHIGLVAGGAFLIARAAMTRLAFLAGRIDPRPFAWLVAAAAALSYALLSGQAVSAQRAFLFFSFGGLASASGRQPSLRGIFGVTALLLLATRPGLLFSGGFQLSFAAVAALCFGRHPATDASAGRLRRGLQGVVIASAAATLATLPLTAWHFQAIPFAGLPANAIAVPWFAGVVLPAALCAAALSALPAAGGEIVLGPLVWIAEVTGEVVEACAARVPPGSRAPVSTVACIGVALGGALALARPQKFRARVAAVIAATLCLTAAQRCAPTVAGPEAWFFAVGHGDAALVRDERAAIVIDAGGSAGDGFRRGAVARALDHLRVTDVALLVVSHADLDHRSAVPEILETIRVRELWLPPGGVSDPQFAAVVDRARELGTRILERGVGDPARTVGSLRVRPLWPPHTLDPLDASENNRSLVVRVESPGRALLFAGDLEREGEVALLEAAAGEPQKLRADILKVGHHGSSTSSHPAFLQRVKPSEAVISAAWPSRFGLPAPEVLRQLEEAGARIHTTGRRAVRLDLGIPATSASATRTSAAFVSRADRSSR